jgi:hypothetical protein
MQYTKHCRWARKSHRCSSRENNIKCKFNLQAGFLTYVLPQDSFPSGTNLQYKQQISGEQWYDCLSDSHPGKALRIYRIVFTSAAANAYSGATVTDSNRVPIWLYTGRCL